MLVFLILLYNGRKSIAWLPRSAHPLPTWFIWFSFAPISRKWQKLAWSKPCQSTFSLTRSKKRGLPSNFQMLKSRYEKNAKIEKDKRGKPLHFRQSYFNFFNFTQILWKITRISIILAVQTSRKWFCVIDANHGLKIFSSKRSDKSLKQFSSVYVEFTFAYKRQN